MGLIFRKILFGLGLCLLASSSITLVGQSSTGSIAGDVVDTSGAVIKGATVEARETGKNLAVKTQTDEAGHFVLPDLPTGSYVVTVTCTGFRPVQRTGIPLHPLDRLSIGQVALPPGQVSEVVTVTQQAALLQTESGERSDVLVAKQIENIQVNGRSPLDLVKLVPGVVSTANFQVGGNGIGSNGGPTGLFVNGSRNNTNQITIDGISNLDSGSNNTMNTTISLDATAEFKILTSSYQAEYGRSSGAQIAIVTKSGTESFHGSGYWYHRHESMNANTWLNNRNGVARSLYRYNDPGYTIGGPVIIPHLFPRDNKKLFFFWGEEFQRQLSPVSAKNITVPTAAERDGDFSQTVDQNGNHVTIKNPYTHAALPGNIVPSNLLYGPGQALLNIFPLPNVTGQKGYNYTSQVSGQLPRREDVLRIDYNITQNLRAFGHYIGNNQQNDSPYGGNVFGLNFPLVTIHNPTFSKGYAAGLTWVISPTMTNELLFGTSHNEIHYDPGTDALTRTKSGIQLPLLYPDANQADIIPSSSFSGQHMANSPSFGSSNGPFYNFNTIINLSDGLSKVLGKHFLKAGFFLERSRKDQVSGAAFNGNYSFGDSSSNPYDTGYGYSNAIMGVYQTFTQASSFGVGKYRYYNIEGYVQDTWKVFPNLTLDYGIRLAWYQPHYDSAYQLSTFDPSLWSAAKAPRLYMPCLVGTTKMACDAQTNTTLASYAIGLEVPNSGDPYNGVVQSSPSNPYLMENRPPQIGPRLGIAYQPFRNDDTVLRAGGGIYYDRMNGNRTFDIFGNPPITVTPTITYGFAQSISSSGGLIGPPAMAIPDKTGRIPTTYNYTAGVQQRVRGGFIFDIAYVGMAARHLQMNRNINFVPYGATFLLKNQDPTLVATQPNALPGTNALTANFLRPYRGFGNITIYEGSGISNYNSLQVQMQRRFNSVLFMNAVYTWSKSLALGSIDAASLRSDEYNHQAYYGPTAFDRRHLFSVNYVVTEPHVSTGFRVTNAITNGWQLSGVTQISTGSPLTPGYSISSATSANITGSSTEGARVRVLCDPRTHSSNPYYRFNANCFAAPLVGSIGLESGNNFLNNPGRINFDMALQRQFTIHERVSFQFRVDAFNVFNHPNFTGINSTVNFNGTYPNNLTIANAAYVNGTVVNQNGFGAVSSVADPRILQTLIRVKF